MGHVEVSVKVFATENGHGSAELSMLVDTGAIFTLVPKAVLEQLGVHPRRSEQFQTIDGQPIERAVGVIEIEVQGRQPPGPIPVIFGELNDGPVLGVTALESMGFKVNPVAGILEPIELRMWLALKRVGG